MTARPAENDGPMPKKRQRHRHHKQITEAEVGITARLYSHLPRFAGLMKARYSDFIVNEVRPDGTVVRLTDITFTANTKPAEITVTKLPQELTAEGLVVLEKLVSPDDVQAFTSFRSLCADFEDSTDETRNGLLERIPSNGVLFRPIADKQTRGEVHAVIKRCFPYLVSEVDISKQADGTQLCSVRIRHKKHAKEADPRAGAQRWDKDTPQYCHFTLFKVNFDTPAALAIIAKGVRAPVKNFNICGTKDKRGVTSQRVSVSRITAESLAKQNSHLPLGIRLGNFEYSSHRLQLGELYGNRFTIVIRELEGDDEHVNQSLSAVGQGFINYFGMQRFGTTSVPTHEVGIAVLRGDWKNAISIILKSKLDIDADAFQEAHDLAVEALSATEPTVAREVFGRAAKATPRWAGLERNLFQSLAAGSGPLNYRGAYERIPRGLRMMHLHALQSFAFNSMASRRIQLYGSAVVVGDIVAPGDAVLEATMDSDQEEDLEEHAPTKKGKALPTVLVIESPEQAKQFQLTDVVLTIPGPAAGLVFPRLEAVDRTAYECFLTEIGAAELVTREKLLNQTNHAVYGGYRRLITLPRDMTWETKEYTSAEETLTLSDWDVLCNNQMKPAQPTPEEQTRRALVWSFTLPASSYATMLVREVCEDRTVHGA
eukprot:TRINITY_DN5638_c0_g1_i1.p1 TRINITY_DN5638_c0_g1~~TRINITY_DN5638_c0_g1_i1.p1  ORF type:complete len:663 (+),score=108.80 TRINITY_DN5638_c0_g1_i1:22-1989(+)